MNVDAPPGAPKSRIPSPWIGVKVRVCVSKLTPSFPAYAGAMARPDTFTHCPFCRTCTARDANHPPSQKWSPSWNTTRLNVCEVGKV